MKKAMTVSTNDQFQYETEEKLEDQLQLEYGTVSSYTLYVVVPCTIDALNKADSAHCGSNFVEFFHSMVKEQEVARHSLLLFGCGTGRNSFLLTKVFDKVTAVDYCGRFLDAALKIQSGTPVHFGRGVTAVTPEGTKPNNVVFKQVLVYV